MTFHGKEIGGHEGVIPVDLWGKIIPDWGKIQCKDLEAVVWWVHPRKSWSIVSQGQSGR